MGDSTATSPRRCHDCHERLGPGAPARVADGDTLCVPCFEVREMAWRSLGSQQSTRSRTRRGPRHQLPQEIAARTTIMWAGGVPVEDAEPIREISRHGFRIETRRQLTAGQRLSCEARLPSHADRCLPLEVEVRWCRGERSTSWHAGVEVVPADLDRYGELYREVLVALGEAA